MGLPKGEGKLFPTLCPFGLASLYWLIGIVGTYVGGTVVYFMSSAL